MATAQLTAVISTKGAAQANRELTNISKSSKNVESNVIKAEKRFQSFGKNASAAIASVDGPMGGIASRVSSLTTLLTSGTGAMTLFAGSIAAVTAGLTIGVNELDKLNLELAKSEALINATGGAAGFTAEQLQEQAQALAFATLASVEGVQKAQGILLTFDRVQGDVFTSAIGYAQDLAAVYGGDVSTQATQLGKALQDPIKGITALNRVGVTFTDTQKEQIELFVKNGQVAQAQEVILANLAAQVGGAGGAVAKDSLAGAFDTAGQAFSNLVANFAESSGTYSGVLGFVNTLNKGLLVASELADENSETNYNNLISQAREIRAEIKAIESGNSNSIFSFFGGDSQVELNAAIAKLKEVQDEIDRINELNEKKAVIEKAALEKSQAIQQEKSNQDIAREKSVAEQKQAILDEAEAKKLQSRKDAAQRELETILSLNDSELESINAKEASRLENLKASRAQLLITEQEYQAARAEIELNASVSRQALLDEESDKDQERRLKDAELAKQSITSLTDDLIDAAASGENLGEVVSNSILSISKSILKAGAEQLIQDQILSKIQTAAFVSEKAAEVSATVAQAGLNAFTATAAIPITGPALAPAAAGAAIAAATSLGAGVLSAASARYQGGSVAAGQSTTFAEKGELEILTPASSSRMRTKQQMQQIMGEGGGQNNVSLVVIDQSTGSKSFDQSEDDEGRIILMIRDTVASDVTNPNSQISKSINSNTTAERIR